MRRYLLQIFAVVVIVITLFSCEDEGYMSSPDAQLVFSVDTIAFDTIFTTIGSTTQRFTVRNPYGENILISRIRLGGGDMSNFRLNINGMVGSELYDLEVPAKDSIYIFVEVTIDPNGQNLPMVVQDSIEFTTNTNFQDVNLVAYGQDFVLVKGEVLETQTWTSEKPYLVYDFAYVDSTSTLTIEPGAHIHFHKGAGLYVKGTVIANGTFDEQITLQGDRLESSYQNIPGQWSGVRLYSGSHNNSLNYVSIKNANIGLQVGTIENEGYSSLELSNSKIENMSYAGVFAMKSKISGHNNLIANCGFYAAALLVGGEYEFNHTTIANYWGNYSSRARSSSSLAISNVLVIGPEGNKVSYSGDLKKATFGNSIVYGNLQNEIELGDNGENEFNYFFDHCILQIPDTTDVSDHEHYSNVWLGPDYDPRFIDPYQSYNYQLDTLSAAIDIGEMEIAKEYPLDLLNKNRISDSGPDLGAYERIDKKDED